MRRTLMMFISLFALASVAVFFMPKSAHAYPGFARKYNFPCSFCHIQWPRLADTGHFFKDRGFMMSPTGKANGLDMMFEKPGNQSYFPIGFHMDMAYGGSAVNGVNMSTNNNVTSTKGTPTPNSITGNGGWNSGAGANTVWDIESGGLINNWISFWVQPGGGAAGGSTAPGFGIVKLWVRFDDLFNTTWANLYVGKASADHLESNQRALMIGQGSPFTMYDFQPGIPEVANNAGAAGGASFVGPGGLYVDADGQMFNNDWTELRYFGYHINSPSSCMTQSAFSLDPCETRVNVDFIPNQGLYGSGPGDGVPGSFSPLTGSLGTVGGAALLNNGFSFYGRVSQSFGGWGRTNGEQIGAFALVGMANPVSMGTNGQGANPNAVYSREGIDVATNPIPNGGLNIDGAWEIVNDPSSLIATPFLGVGAQTGGVEYMVWYVDVSWQPTFGGFFAQSGTNSNLMELIYNQLDMMEQPYANIPGNFNNVLSFALLDRYWLWGSDRADISLFATWQYIVNDGVAGSLSAFAAGNGVAGSINQPGFFGNVSSNNFAVGLDFAY